MWPMCLLFSLAMENLDGSRIYFSRVSPYRNDTDKKCHYLQELDFYLFKFQLFPILTVNHRLLRSRRENVIFDVTEPRDIL